MATQLVELEGLARQLAGNALRIRDAIARTKASHAQALADILETYQDMERCRGRLAWIDAHLGQLRQSLQTETAVGENSRASWLEDLSQWENEQAEEREHEQFLREEYTKMLAHRRWLATSLVAMDQRLQRVHAQEELLARKALQVTLDRLHHTK